MHKIKWLCHHASKVKWMIAAATVLMIVEMVASIASIGIQQSIIDDVFMEGQTERFWPLLCWMAAAYIVYSVLFTFGPHVIHRTYAKIRLSMCRELMERMHRTPVSVIQNERTASYVYHFTNDISTSTNLISNEIPRIVQQLAGIIVLTTITAAASPWLLLSMIGCSAIYIALGYYFGPKRKKAAAEVNQHQSDLLVHLEEGVSSTREVVAFHRDTWEADIYNRKFGTLFASIMKEGKLINKQILMSEPFRWGAILLVLLIGGTLVLNESLSLGMFIITYQFTSRMMDALYTIYQFVMGLSSKMASVERIRGVMDGESLSEGTISLAEPEIYSIELDRLTFRYSPEMNSVLNELSLQIPRGSKVAFVGASGGGKSTVASLLTRFYEPEDGAIYVNGKPLQQLKRSDWTQKATIVFQEPYLFPDTIRVNLLMGLNNISEDEMIEACRATLIHDYISSLPDGYDTIIGERGVTLSGGQRQRLALARAIIRKSDVLILDEATSSLDLESERQIQENLDRLWKGKMMIVIAHRLSTVQNADMIYVLSGGRLVEQGTHHQLLRMPSSNYRSLVLKEKELFA
jgi:ABC-type multidrug transport system fused ATPase/permease subunit